MMSTVTFDLFVHLGRHRRTTRFPIVYASAIKGIATLDLASSRTDISPRCWRNHFDKILAPAINRDDPFQLLVL